MLILIIITISWNFAAIKNIRSKILFLKGVACPCRSFQERLERQTRSVRHVYFYFLSVIFLWLPSGIVIFLRRVLPRLEVNNFSAELRNTGLKQFASLSVLIYLSLCPLISMLFIEKIQTWGSVLRKIITRRHRNTRARNETFRLLQIHQRQRHRNLNRNVLQQLH